MWSYIKKHLNNFICCKNRTNTIFHNFNRNKTYKNEDIQVGNSIAKCNNSNTSYFIFLKPKKAQFWEGFFKNHDREKLKAIKSHLIWLRFSSDSIPVETVFDSFRKYISYLISDVIIEIMRYLEGMYWR